MPRKVHTELWVEGLRDAIKSSCGRGWTVQEKNGQIRLNVRTAAIQGSAVLPFPWERSATGDVQARVRNIYTLCQEGYGLKDAARIAGTNAPKERIEWEGLVAAFREKKTNTGLKISSKTWDEDYRPYLEFSTLAMSATNSPTNAVELAQAVLNNWEGRPRSSEKALIACKALLDFSIAHHGIPARSWSLSRDQIKELRGRPLPRKDLAILEDSEIVQLSEEVARTKNGARWKNYVVLTSTYGLRREEPWFCTPKKHPKYGIQMWCRYEKTSGFHKTQPRWLLPIPPECSGWENLAEAMHSGQLVMPETLPEAWNTLLSKLDLWRHLVEKYKRQGQHLKPGAIRDAYSYRAHQKNVALHHICKAMGHSLITHQKHYVWARDDSIFDI